MATIAVAKTAGAFVRQNWRIIIAIILAIVVIIIIWKFWDRIKGFFRRTYGHYGQEVPEYRKVQLEQIATQAKAAIYDPTTLSGTKAEILNQIFAINDDELLYLAKYYKTIAQGNSLYMDIDDEFLPGIEIDEKLMARLAALGETD